MSAPPAASAPTDEARLRLETPETYVMYHADEGDRGTGQGFAIPVAVVPGSTAAARNIKVVVDASGLRGVARVAKGGYGNCTGDGWVFTCEYGTLRNDGESNVPFALLGVDAWSRAAAARSPTPRAPTTRHPSSAAPAWSSAAPPCCRPKRRPG
ncbi:hypothetical protein [Streptomyces sp. NPDC058330]|uniref:hypothetical protein n=1 Tax=Streptomyces sp. NPDC058330 TaxID=3346449 RepID=UPI0036E4D7A2